ncbi:MAG TPA: prephenate dehydratase [Acidimicrobiia bacterium]|nr:prephenate dehydratase [Acidimicrobiia bacterium]
MAGTRVAFLGPPGSFGEEALLTQPDLADGDLVWLPSMTEILSEVEAGNVELGFVGIENSIEGTVNSVIDALVFDCDLLVQREVLFEVTENLLAPAGTALADIRRVVSFPNALGQCRRWVTDNLDGVDEVAATSTSEAARMVAAGGLGPGASAALGSALAAKIHGLEILVPHVEDHRGNTTRFVVVSAPGPGRIPRPTGHDKTSVVCFQRANEPGSLHTILGLFKAFDINLTKLESRPAKTGLGDYCFIIDFEGHIADEVVAECLRDLHTSLAELKFLGSYPAAGEHGAAIRRDAEERWRAADAWVGGLRDWMGNGPVA